MEHHHKLSHDLLRGHVETMILKQLSAGDKYGYEICKLIAQESAGEFELKEATLYSSLRKMEHELKVSSYWGDETFGGRRKYYAMTEVGKQSYINNKRLWESARQILEKLI